MAKKNQMSDNRALSFITEQSEQFEIELQNGKKKKLRLYPLQLARLAMISQRLVSLDMAFDGADDEPVKAMWKICSEKPQRVAEIIAIATLRTKIEIEDLLEERTNEILWSPSMTPTGLANVLSAIVFQSYHMDFMAAIRSVKMLQVVVSQSEKAERIAPMEGKAFGDK